MHKGMHCFESVSRKSDALPTIRNGDDESVQQGLHALCVQEKGTLFVDQFNIV